MSEIENQNEVLIRQLPSYRFTSGRLDYRAFKPRERDLFKLSTSKESGINAQAAFDHFTKVMNADSVGVAKIKVHEVAAQGLPSFHSPLDPQDCDFNTHHAHVDYTDCPDQAAVAKNFLKIAIEQDRVVRFAETFTPQLAVVADAAQVDTTRL